MSYMAVSNILVHKYGGGGGYSYPQDHTFFFYSLFVPDLFFGYHRHYFLNPRKDLGYFGSWKNWGGGGAYKAPAWDLGRGSRDHRKNMHNGSVPM